MILHEDLKRFGLSENESKAYATLVGLKEARASDIAKLSRVPRNKIYAVMEGLHKKGFVDIIPEKVIRFRAVPFESAFRLFLEENEKLVNEIIKTGEKISNQLKNTSFEKRDDVGEFTVYKSRKVLYKKLEDMIREAKESVFLCLEASELKRLYFLARSSGKETSVITKIDAGDKTIAKKWSLFSTVKHKPNIPSAKIAIIDNREAFIFQTNSPMALYSTDKSFVALIKNFIDMLWNSPSSISIKERVAEIETGRPAEEIKYIHGRKNFYDALPELHMNTKRDIIIVTTPNGLVRINKNLKKLFEETKKRGVRIRCLTAINKSNTEAAKDLGVEIRHIEKVHAVFSCYDNSYLVLLQINDDSLSLDSPDDVAIISNQCAAVSSFRTILETLWEHAKPLEARLHEIETGKPSEEVRFIREESSVYEATKELSSTAKSVICNISTEGSPERAVKFGTLDTDMDRAKNGVKLRYMYPITKNNMELVKHIMRFAEVRHVDATPIRVRVVDDKSCLLRHIEEEFINEKFCIFSQAKDFVVSMKMFFEKMWSTAVPAEERIRQLENEADIEIIEARKIINQYKEKFVDEFQEF